MRMSPKRLFYLFLPKGPESIKHALIRTSFLNLIARGFGYLRHVAVAVLLGFSIHTDAFFMALSLIGLFLIFADVFDSIGVPNLVKAYQTSEEEFKKLAGLLLTFTLLLSLFSILVAISILPLVLHVPKGFSPQAIEHTKTAYILLLPYLLFNFIFHHFGAVLRSRRRFTHYFLGELIFSFSLFVLTCTLLILTKSWLSLPISMSVAQALASLYMLYTGREFLHLSLFFDQRVKDILRHFIFLSLLYGVFHLFILVDRLFASYLGEKAVSALSYGLMVAGIPRGIAKLEHMAITALSENPTLERLSFFLKKVVLYTPPIAVVFYAFSEILVRLLFGYGKFSTLDIELISTAVRYYSLSLPFMFLWPILYRYYQVKERLTPIAIGALLGVAFNFLANYVFVFKLNLAIAGICLGTFSAYLFLCAFAYVYAKYRAV